MRTIMTRSAQKKVASETYTISKKARTKPIRAEPAFRMSTRMTTRASSPLPVRTTQIKQPVLQKAKAAPQVMSIQTREAAKKIQAQVTTKMPKLKLISQREKPQTTRKVRSSTKTILPVVPTFLSNQSKLQRSSKLKPIDTSDLQSQESTSFEAQSARGAYDTSIQHDATVDGLRCLTSDLDGLPSACQTPLPFQTMASLKELQEPCLLKDQDAKLNSTDVKFNLVTQTVEETKKLDVKTLPIDQEEELQEEQEQIETLTCERAQEQTALLPVIVDYSQPLEPPVIEEEVETEFPDFLDPVWAAIDENERRIKAEEARFAELVARRSIYSYYMDPYEHKVMMQDASTRLLNFDPAWDLPAEACPLPRPWEQLSRTSCFQAPPNFPVFAFPRPPRRS